jgi:hypothetical protein
MKALITTAPRKEKAVADVARRGIYALPVAGVLTAAPWVFILGGPSVKSDPDGYARNLISLSHAASVYVYLFGFVCLLFGLLALYGYLARPRDSSWAAGGLIVSVVAIALALPVFGIVGLADQVLGDVYLAGHKDVSAAMLQLAGGTFSDRINNYFGVLIFVSLIGAIAIAVAVWRSGTLPKWAGVILTPGIVLSLTFSPGLAWIGSLCLVIGGIGLAGRVSQASSQEPAVQSARA